MSQIADSLMRGTFTHEDLNRRITLAKAVSESILFRQTESDPKKLVSDYFEHYEHEKEDEDWVREFLQEKITKESLFRTISSIEEKAAIYPTIVLHIAKELRAKDISTIGTWLRKNIHPDILIRCRFEPHRAAGCGISWKGVLYDFSLGKEIDEKHDQILGFIKQTI